MGRRNRRKDMSGKSAKARLQEAVFDKIDCLQREGNAQEIAEQVSPAEEKTALEEQKGSEEQMSLEGEQNLEESPRKQRRPRKTKAQRESESLEKIRKRIEDISPVKDTGKGPVVEKSEATIKILKQGLQALRRTKVEVEPETLQDPKKILTKEDVPKLLPQVYLGGMCRPKYMNRLFCEKVEATSNLKFIGGVDGDYVVRRTDSRVLMIVTKESNGIRVKGQSKLVNINRKFICEELSQFYIVLVLAALNENWDLLELGKPVRT